MCRYACGGNLLFDAIKSLIKSCFMTRRHASAEKSFRSLRLSLSCFVILLTLLIYAMMRRWKVKTSKGLLTHFTRAILNSLVPLISNKVLWTFPTRHCSVSARVPLLHRAKVCLTNDNRSKKIIFNYSIFSQMMTPRY